MASSTSVLYLRNFIEQVTLHCAWAPWDQIDLHLNIIIYTTYSGTVHVEKCLKNLSQNIISIIVQ